jgi:hypothetical protein
VELTMPIDIDFDTAGVMYVLEFGDGRQPHQSYAAASDRLLRLDRDGLQKVVLDRLNYPTAMAFYSVGDLYIAVSGAFTGPGQGVILKVPCLLLDAPESCPPPSALQTAAFRRGSTAVWSKKRWTDSGWCRSISSWM